MKWNETHFSFGFATFSCFLDCYLFLLRTVRHVRCHVQCKYYITESVCFDKHVFFWLLFPVTQTESMCSPHSDSQFKYALPWLWYESCDQIYANDSINVSGNVFREFAVFLPRNESWARCIALSFWAKGSIKFNKLIETCRSFHGIALSNNFVISFTRIHQYQQYHSILA